MKDNFNIDELFKQKFDNFQPDVDPGVWTNIQAGIGVGATGVAVGGISARAARRSAGGAHPPCVGRAREPARARHADNGRCAL